MDAGRLPKSVAHLITEAKGGEGAVRELCEIILEAQEGLTALASH